MKKALFNVIETTGTRVVFYNGPRNPLTIEDHAGNVETLDLKPRNLKAAGACYDDLSTVYNLRKINRKDRNAFSPLSISYGMSGKMHDIQALSTSSTCNKLCAARARNKKSICAYCFARKTIAHYGDLAKNLARNTAILTSRELAGYELPVIDQDVFRLESFGDLANVTQAKNYLQIAAANPETTFAIWTKNPAFLDKAIRELGKPRNLVCILSSYRLNTPDPIRWNWVDHVFTVYDDETIEREGIKINCGARDCRGCMRCYTIGNADLYINERLK